jgi:hypothetical protein
VARHGVSVADDALIELPGEQIAYYRARAIEYDRTAPFVDEDGYPEPVAALERFARRGRVLDWRVAPAGGPRSSLSVPRS